MTGEFVPVDKSEHRCPECGRDRCPLATVECAADGCKGIATTLYPYCTDACAEGHCPNCGQPRTAMECSPEECKP